MKRYDSALIAAAFVVTSLFYARAAKADPLPDYYDPNPIPGDDWNEEWNSDPAVDTALDPVDFGVIDMPANDGATESARVSAFLWMIGESETSPAAMADGSAFTTFYGFKRFSNLSDHPVLTGEMIGTPLPDDWCRRAGFGVGCVTTAAGAYQINVPTWGRPGRPGVRDASPLWGDRLPDFSPQSQMEAARRVLIMDGILPYVKRGDFAQAVRRAGARWASLPASTAGQGGHNVDWLAARYDNALQRFA